MPPPCGMVAMKSTTTTTTKKEEKKRVTSLHCRAAKLILSELSISTDDKLKTLKLLPLMKQQNTIKL